MRLYPFLFSLFVCASFWACCADAQDDNTLRILSYNIHHGVGTDGELDLERIARVIQSASPDVVSLQEVDKNTRRSNHTDQAKELARLTKMKFVYGASMNFQGGEYGNAILTNLPIRNPRVIPLPGEPRSALCATLKLPNNDASNGEILFVATHLDTSHEPRLKSVSLIEKALAAQSEIPTILAGDLNAIPTSPTMQELGKTWMNTTSLESLPTVPVVKPTQQIDYILCRPFNSWAVRETKVLDEEIASDHRPILVTLQFLPKAEDAKDAAGNEPMRKNSK